ncbi:tripeptidyl-peptidase I [Ceratobasidium sp. AG-Ba]|nr:tripeptidyl-peptidase I [Ceratobasidium sp. AG-Ba]
MYLLPLLAFVALTSASSLTTRHVLRRVPSGWTHIASAPGDHLIDMRIGLKQGRMNELLATLTEISDPGHERYGMYMSKRQVEELVAPRQETVNSVERWLNAHEVKITGRSPAGDWIHVLVPVKRAEKMLNTRYNVYRHTSGTHVVRTESYALPRSLDEHIDVIQPTTFFGKVHERPARANEKRAPADLGIEERNTVDLSCNFTIAPDCLQKLYRTGGYTPSGKGRSILGIAGFLDLWASHSDFWMFRQKFLPQAKGADFAVELVNNGTNFEAFPSDEGNLDTQYGAAMTYPIPNVYYSTGGRASSFTPDENTPTNTNEPYVEWINYMMEKPDGELPLTITTSYGDDEQTVPPDYANRVCKSFAQLGARGVSLLFSSGDDGVGPGNCYTNIEPVNQTQFMPMFPATCPWVTAVGATYGMSPEIGAPFSQGGFSNYFSRPSYQNQAVNAYLGGLGNTYEGLYNKSGRAFPDVSAQGLNYQVYLYKRIFYIRGTSAACPTVAGIIALLNDYLVSRGKSPLGFLNPWLYKNSKVFNDIVLGSNPGCGTPGFNATAGWDPVTGLGTPDFEKMKAAL